MEIVSVQYSGRDNVPKVGIQCLTKFKTSNENRAHSQFEIQQAMFEFLAMLITLDPSHYPCH